MKAIDGSTRPTLSRHRSRFTSALYWRGVGCALSNVADERDADGSGVEATGVRSDDRLVDPAGAPLVDLARNGRSGSCTRCRSSCSVPMWYAWMLARVHEPSAALSVLGESVWCTTANLSCGAYARVPHVEVERQGTPLRCGRRCGGTPGTDVAGCRRCRGCGLRRQASGEQDDAERRRTAPLRSSRRLMRHGDNPSAIAPSSSASANSAPAYA